MRHASLFTGIGGFDWAAEKMGWENVFQVEIDPFCQKVLEKNFPNVNRYGDIKQFDGTQYRGTVDVLTGGFPCQPFSVAGKRKGKKDDRFLWPEMLRVISEVRPSIIVGENVTGIIGLALEQVLTEVEAEGYYTETFIIPACAVNAPHRRDRIWIIAYTTSNASRSWRPKSAGQFRQTGVTNGGNETTSDTNGDERCERRMQSNGLKTTERYTGAFDSRNNGDWQNFPTQPPVCGRNDGIPNRVDRIKGLGNAIVPQVAYEIFKAIDQVMRDREST